MEGHVHYVLMELLKNCMSAVLRHPVKSLDTQSSQITMRIAQTPGNTSFCISDMGGGMSLAQVRQAFDWFYSSEEKFEPTYTYGRAFGAPLAGLGVGLPMSRVYARHLGGDVNMVSVSGYGTYTVLDMSRELPRTDLMLLSCDASSAWDVVHQLCANDLLWSPTNRHI